MGVNYAVLIQ